MTVVIRPPRTRQDDDPGPSGYILIPDDLDVDAPDELREQLERQLETESTVLPGYYIATYPKRLSDAILKGAKLRPQSYGQFYFQGKSCVLGAAMEGTFGANEFALYLHAGTASTPGFALRALMVKLEQIYPVLNTPWTRACPMCGIPPMWAIETPPLRNWMIHLNDDHHFSRERIASELQKARL